MSWYVDSSAILKLIFTEKETAALDKVMGNQYVTSMISRVEVNRSVNRINISLLNVASDVLNQFRFSEVSVTILRIAEHFGPQITLKSIDAIHMATVITLGENIEGMITYDKQLAKNAYNLGIKVLSPGA